MENPTTIAIDLSKSVFEIAVEREGRICQRKRLNRREMVTFLSQCPRATVLMVQPALVEALSQAPSPVPEPLHAALFAMLAEASELEERACDVGKQLKALARTVPLVERLETIPGVGLLNATAFSAMVGNFRASSRDGSLRARSV